MFSVLPLLSGLLFAAASLTPSLIPRDWIMQGALAGVSMAAGYLATQFLLALWRTLQIPVLAGRRATIAHAVVAVPVLAVLVRCVALADDWQNSIRLRMDMPLVEATNTTKMLLLAAAVFLVLFVIGKLVQGLFDLLRLRLARHIPVASANVLGLLLAAMIVVTLTRDGVVNAAMRMADSSYAAAQHLTDPNTPPPSEGWQSGGPGSVAEWGLMGAPGRDFVTGGPRAAAISAFTGRPAREPLRIYIGLAQEKDAEDRARLALDEMLRVGAFDRKVLVVASPTGTGWMDPASYDALEYMHNGDVATVAVQYSYLQSPLALIFETDAGLEQTTALTRLVYDHWRSLPLDRRPRLYLHGISLGAWSSMYAFNPFQMMNEPVSGAFWVGPPFPSTLWRQANSARDPASPLILPEVDDGEVIRYASQFAPPDRSGRPWGRLRILFLQHASDAIVFYSPTSLWRRPEWMNEPLAPDVSPALGFTPIVTQLQLALDMLISTSTPPGFGHIYDAEEYIDGWVSVTAPEGWTQADTDRLKAKCGKGGLLGCDNG
ncbi:alpha/beta hydrolase [Paracoccus yeei]|uniref:Alpha/beta-hydrolase family protein n=1 Tax=Paracoccus yeei TaxID=147645 RepID=A0A2D2BX02_9RHOB|nr:alpha/beta-hydrolase family protein [Paracoccus yeei]ATQ54709.1 hypothetical protein PYTT13_02060 [Paracoccus yeei]